MPELPKEQYQKKRKRPSSSYGNKGTPFYNSQPWRECSKKYRAARPMCEVCDHKGSQMTDHIIQLIFDNRGQPLPEGGAPFDKDNHMAMCHRCHNKKRGKEAHGFEVDSIKKKTGYVPKRRKDIIEALEEYFSGG